MRPTRLRHSAGLAATVSVGFSACGSRRPTQAELNRWNAFDNNVVVFSVLWDLVALAILSVAIWDVMRQRQGYASPNWPRWCDVVAIAAASAMLLATIAFVPLWTA